ncbi:MAG: NAD-dependent DNA ligase LigA [Treponema sp.]|nr:NAD-dependent DNA ligase LigA [Treponema sp.]
MKNIKPAKKERIKVLEGLVKKYQESYYAGAAEISDGEFDLLWDELTLLDPANPVLQKIGTNTQAQGLADSLADGFPKAKHLIPMGSQNKAANPNEFLEWAGKAGLPGQNKGQAESFLVQYKLDGASLELQYEKGVLARAVTRGDGNIGDEITCNALRMKGVLKKLNLPFSGGIRGEVIMLRETHKQKYADKANCRNAANGIMRRKDGLGCEDLCLIVYDASVPGDDSFFIDELEKLDWLKKRGFTLTETKAFSSAAEIISFREKAALGRDSLAYDIDGLVVKDNIIDMADLRRARPEKQIAFKFELETAFSILKAVQWSESGATYTPIGIIEPVRLAGTTVQRANLNNPGLIRGMGLKIGSAITVVKRGEIIPKIESLAPQGAVNIETTELKEIEFPQCCGTCGAELIDEGTRLYCPNAACAKRILHRLEKWAGVLEIRELGEKLLYQLFSKNRLRSIADLYSLTAEELAGFERMGELSAAKVVRHIRTKRSISLEAFIAGFDFEGVGELIMEKVVSAGFDTLEKLRAAGAEELAQVYGLGEITAKTIVGGLKDCSAEIDRVLASGVISISPRPDAGDLPLKGYSFCFTGELESMKRAQAEEKIKALGASAKPSVVKGLSFLVTNDPESGSGKNKKARELGVSIINEEQFLDLIKNPAEAGKLPVPGRDQGELF